MYNEFQIFLRDANAPSCLPPPLGLASIACANCAGPCPRQRGRMNIFRPEENAFCRVPRWSGGTFASAQDANTVSKGRAIISPVWVVISASEIPTATAAEGIADTT